jgi:hypothetical protein
MKVKHVIVDGSNIATEGRDAPSLAQLDEAVQAFIEEYAPEHVTVVVDATFPNRIDRKERQIYEDAVNANELITPPAGAIGRGDAFILQIARRADASILSNDSFQEFHGEYPWLFEKGRLIGGKPVPHVGWVFMDRAPVRGPTSRRAVSEARKVAKAADRSSTSSRSSEAAEAPASPRRRRTRAKAAGSEGTPSPTEGASRPDGAGAPEGERTGGGGRASGDRGGASTKATKGVDPYNDALPFIEFVGQHPVGTEVDAVIERFSSHGAYVMVGAARAYVPLRNMANPAPRSAKEVLQVGDEQRFVVVSIDPPVRGIDLAVPGVLDVSTATASIDPDELATVEDDAAAEQQAAESAGARGDGKRSRAATAPAKRTRAGSRARTSSVASQAEVSGDEHSTRDGEPTGTDQTDPGKAPAEKSATRKTAAKKTTAKKAAAKKGAARKAAAGKAAAGMASAGQTVPEHAGSGDDGSEDAGPEDAAAERPATRKAAAKKAAAKKAAAKKTTAKKTTAKTSAAKTTAAKKTAAKKATAKTSAAKKTATKKAATKKAATKKAAAERTATSEVATGAAAGPQPDET